MPGKATTFFKRVKDNPKDRIEVEVGDSKQTDFKPQFKLMRWNNEVNFSLRAEEHPAAQVREEGEKIIYDTPDYEVHQYDKPEAGEDGGFEFEWLLKSKPASNVLTTTIQTKGLNFFHQPALTQQEIDEGASRPENVEGSYAVYHKTKGGMNDTAGMEYKTGKAFHIYRPKVKDANGAETWGELNIDEEELTVTIDQAWLDNAVYPVVVDPTFGYTSIGASNSKNLAFQSGDGSFIQGQTFVLSEQGTLDSLHVAAKLINDTSETIDLFIGVYEEDSVASGQHGKLADVEQVDTVFSDTAAFYTVNANSENLPATNIILGGMGDGEDMPATSSLLRLMHDTGGPSVNEYTRGASGVGSYGTYKAEDPLLDAASTSTDIKSIYATYTAASGGGTNRTQATGRTQSTGRTQAVSRTQAISRTQEGT